MEEKMNERILLAGSGGQGIMFLGKLLARAATSESLHTTWIPSYGAEMRGGTAHCFVRISSSPIAAPIFEQPTTAIILNQPSFDKFAAKLDKNGFIIVNNSLATSLTAQKARLISLPLNQWALQIGSLRTVNILALGALLKYKNIVQTSTIKTLLQESFSRNKETADINLKAFQWGYDHG